jgi:hypothetical protein
VTTSKYLLDVVVCEVDHTVAVGPHDALNAVREYYLTFARVEEPLYLVVFADNFFMHGIAQFVRVVLVQELHVVVLIFFLLGLLSVFNLYRLGLCWRRPQVIL